MIPCDCDGCNGRPVTDLDPTAQQFIEYLHNPLNPNSSGSYDEYVMHYYILLTEQEGRSIYPAQHTGISPRTFEVYNGY